MGKSRVLTGMVLTAGVFLQASCFSQGRLTEGTQPRPYPYDTEIVEALDVQVFRDGSHIELVNHTTQHLSEFDLWLNERYVRHIDDLPPGGSLKLSLYEFLDEYKEPFRGGGIWTTNLPEPIVKAEVETPEGLVGLIAIPDRDR